MYLYVKLFMASKTKSKTLIELCDDLNIPIYFRNNKTHISIDHNHVLKLLQRRTIPKNVKSHKSTTYPNKKLYYLKTVENMLKTELDNPNVIDYHAKLGWYKDLQRKYSKQALTIYKIFTAVKRKGVWQYDIPNLNYRADYAYPDLRLILEVNEYHHNKKERTLMDYNRTQLIEAFGWQIENIHVDDPGFDLDDAITNVRELIDLLDDEVSVDKLRKEFNDYDDLGEFGAHFGLSIINSFDKTNPFQIKLKDALLCLKINKEQDPKKYNEILGLFLDEDYDSDEENDNNIEENDEESEVDDIDDDCIIDNDEIDDILEDLDGDDLEEEEEEGTKMVWNRVNKDYIVENGEFIITRQCFAEIAIKANTPQGKEISTKLHRLIEMVVQLFKILESRRRQNLKLLNEGRLKKALEKQNSMETDIRIARLEKENSDLKKKCSKLEHRILIHQNKKN